MVEQKPGINVESQRWINDPQGYADRKGSFLGNVKRGISRIVIAPVVIAIGISGAAVGCDSGKTENTTNPPGATSTQVPGTESGSSTSQANKGTTTSGKNTSTTESQSATTEIPDSKLVSISEVSKDNLPEELSKILNIRFKNGANDIEKILGFEASLASSDQKVSFYLISTKDNTFIANNVKDWGYKIKDYTVNKNVSSGNNPATHIVYRDYDGSEPFFDFSLSGEFAVKAGESGGDYSSRINSLLKTDNAAALISKSISGVVIKDTNNKLEIKYGENDIAEIGKIAALIPVGGDFVSHIGKTITNRETDYKPNGEIRPDYLEGLISSERTAADVKGILDEGIKQEDPSSVPSELQKIFQEKNPDDKIIRVGPNNDGEKMNDVFTTKRLEFSTNHQAYWVFDRTGGIQTGETKYSEKGRWLRFSMEVLDVIPAASPEDPDTKDFYIRGRDSANSNDDVYVRIIIGDYTYQRLHNLGKMSLYSTGLSYFDLTQKYQQDFQPDNLRAENFFQTHKLNEYLNRGDKIDVYAWAEKLIDTATGNVEVPVFKDNRGAHIAIGIAVERFKGVDELAALYH